MSQKQGKHIQGYLGTEGYTEVIEFYSTKTQKWEQEVVGSVRKGRSRMGQGTVREEKLMSIDL